MLQSKLFSKTLKESPKDAQTISHQYLVRGGFIDQLISGVYSFLPLGMRVHRKIEEIIRSEMNALGAQELSLPTLQPKSLWLKTGRWDHIDPPLFKLKDRHGRDLALGSTHEEVITDLVRKMTLSYKDLPVALYQIQNKFRNELRSTGGLLRVREFMMKDLYSFHISEEDQLDYYEKVKAAYLKIFQRCGLKVIPIEASSGTIGGKESHEFACLASTGEDKIIICSACGFATNQEVTGQRKNCPKCARPITAKNAIEAGHIFNLGIKYSQAMAAYFKDQTGQKRPMVMGCYGIGLGRLLATIVEAHHDKKGIIWPLAVAPFQVHLILIKSQDQLTLERADKLYETLEEQNFEVLYDNREISVGEKFADSDLIGIPMRLVVSDKTLRENSVELKKREDSSVQFLKIDQITRSLKKELRSEEKQNPTYKNL